MSNSSPFRRTDPGGPAAPPSGFFRRFRLILHRSTGTALPAVVRAVRDVTRFAEAEATTRMWDAYHRGRAVVLTTYYERAEYLAERFAAKGLTATVEPE
jgi:ATP-dependent Clp protease adapter protein ClpS